MQFASSFDIEYDDLKESFLTQLMDSFCQLQFALKDKPKVLRMQKPDTQTPQHPKTQIIKTLTPKTRKPGKSISRDLTCGFYFNFKDLVFSFS